MRLWSKRRWRYVVSAAVAVMLLSMIVGAVVYWTLKATLPRLDGGLELQHLDTRVVLERDAPGVVTVNARGRLDAAFGLGFAHAQDRFFQMDISRRAGAGELSALFGAGTLPLDRQIRLHRFRANAQRILASFSGEDRRLLERYAAGVNAGLSSLRMRPFEYLVVRSSPAPWLPEDSLLVVFYFYLLLQDSRGDQDYHLQSLAESLPRSVFDFIALKGTEWDAPLVGGPMAAPPLPDADLYSARTRRIESSPGCETAAPGVVNGSNSWAVSGAHTADGAAMLANDMHLPFSLPNPFYRATLRYEDTGTPRWIGGMTVPGWPLVVAGSNGAVAWGLTNGAADWVDLVLVDQSELDDDHAWGPHGVTSIERSRERLLVKGGHDEWLEVRSTIWGPIIRQDAAGRYLAQRWVAHEPKAVNLNLRGLEQAATVHEALDVATRTGMPAQNFVAADRAGNIGWTIAGPIPRRQSPSDVPVWSTAVDEWHGWLTTREYPRVYDPPSGRIWTANARVVDGVDLAKLGNGFYALGARARQIRDGLAELDRVTERDMLALQMDDRALFLERWRNLALRTLAAAPPTSSRGAMRAELATWGGRAAADSVGYRLTRCFREIVSNMVLEPVAARVRERHPDFELSQTGDQHEGVVWRVISERAPNFLPSEFDTWDQALQRAVDLVLATLAADGVSLPTRTWGERNRLSMQHPFSLFIPLVGRWLDMPAAPVAGDVHMPLAQLGTHGPVQRIVVSPGSEHRGLAHLAGGQASNPASPYYGAGHAEWLSGSWSSFLPGPARHRLVLEPIRAATAARVSHSRRWTHPD